MKQLETYALLALVIPLAVYCLTLNSEGGQAGSFVALQAAIVQNHSLAISRNGSDTLQFAGKNYIVYAPGFTFISLPFAEIGFILDGPKAVFPAFAYLMDELCLSIAASIASLLVYKMSLFYTGRRSRSSALFAAFTLAFATGVWPFSVEVFPHVLSMALALAGVYFVLVYTKGVKKSDLALGVAGLALGLATFVEYAAGLFALPILLYLITRESKSSLVSRIANAGTIYFSSFFLLAGVGLNFLYNYEIFKNPLKFPQQAFAYGVHFYLAYTAIHVLYYLVSPYRGILLYSPVLILGFYGLYRMLRTRSSRADAILFLSLFFLIVIFYSSWQDWDGAGGFGPRFLTLGLPFLVIPISFLLSEKSMSMSLRYTFVGLFVVSSLLEGMGAITNFSPAVQNVLTYIPLSYNLPRLLEGRFIVWWAEWFGLLGLTTVEMAFASIFVFIWFVVSWLCLARLPRYQRTGNRKAVEPVRSSD